MDSRCVVRERGSAFLACVLVTMLVVGWVTVAVGANLGRRDLGKTMYERNCALLLSESGINLALMRLQGEDQPPAEFTEKLGAGEVRVLLSDLGDGIYNVEARGQVGSVTRVRHARITKVMYVPHYEWAVAGHKKVDISKGTVDSYDPTLGDYVSQWEAKYGTTYKPDDKHNQDSKLLNGNGSIGSNKELKVKESRVAGNVELPWTAQLDHLDINDKDGIFRGKGSGNGPPEWATTKKNDWKVEMDKARIDGELSVNEDPIVFPPVLKSELMAVEANNNNDLAYRTDGDVVYKDHLEKKDPNAMRLEVKDGGEVILPPGTYYLHELKVKKDGTLRVQGPVKIWVAKKLEVDDGQIITESGLAGDLEIIVAGHDVDKELKDKELDKLHQIYGDTIPDDELWKMQKGNVKFKHQGTFIGTVYAPTGKVKLEKGSDVMGSIIANEVQVKDGASFHFDESLATRVPSGVAQGAFIEARW